MSVDTLDPQRISEQLDSHEDAAAVADAENDYARSRVPESAKRGASSILMVLVGFVTAFFFPLVGGMYLQSNGAPSTWIALVVSFVILIALALVVTSAASREGLTSELLTRGCGFGSVGSVLTTIIYGGTFIIYAGTEGQILASSIDMIWDLPDQIWYVIVGLIFLPLAWNGISSMSRILTWTVPVFLVLVAVAVVIAWTQSGGMPDGIFTAQPEGSVGGFVGVIAVMAGLAGTVGINPLEAADYNRFVKKSEFKRKALITVVLPYALLFFVAMPLGMYFTLATGDSNPSIYFVSLLGLLLGVALAWISQIRVNLTNLHVGSVAFTSASESVGAKKMNRRAWLIIVSLGSIALMLLDVLGNLYVFLEWTGIFLLAWVACVVADLLVVRKMLRIVTGPIEYRSTHLRKYNPVGITALIAATAVGSLVWIFADDAVTRGLSAYIAFLVAFVVHVTLAVATKGRYYLADTTDQRLPRLAKHTSLR